VPEKQPCATKPHLARQLRQRALEARVPAAWVTGESVYGDDRQLRVWLEEPERAHGLAVAGKEYVWLGRQPPQVKTLLAHPWL
jgi:SRSO17 transposase